MAEKREAELLTSLADAIKGNTQLICERMAAMHKELRMLREENVRLRAENTALRAAAKGDAWRLLDIANREIVNLKDEIEERDRGYEKLAAMAEGKG